MPIKERPRNSRGVFVPEAGERRSATITVKVTQEENDLFRKAVKHPQDKIREWINEEVARFEEEKSLGQSTTEVAKERDRVRRERIAKSTPALVSLALKRARREEVPRTDDEDNLTYFILVLAKNDCSMGELEKLTCKSHSTLRNWVAGLREGGLQIRERLDYISGTNRTRKIYYL